MNMLAVWLPYLILVVLMLVAMWKLLGVTKTQGQIIDRFDRIATALENRKS